MRWNIRSLEKPFIKWIWTTFFIVFVVWPRSNSAQTSAILEPHPLHRILSPHKDVPPYDLRDPRYDIYEADASLPDDFVPPEGPAEIDIPLEKNPFEAPISIEDILRVMPEMSREEAFKYMLLIQEHQERLFADEKARLANVERGLFHETANGTEVRLFEGIEDISFDEFNHHWIERTPKPVSDAEFNLIIDLVREMKAHLVLYRNRYRADHPDNNLNDWKILLQAMDQNDSMKKMTIEQREVVDGEMRTIAKIEATAVDGIPQFRIVLGSRREAIFLKDLSFSPAVSGFDSLYMARILSKGEFGNGRDVVRILFQNSPDRPEANTPKIVSDFLERPATRLAKFQTGMMAAFPPETANDKFWGFAYATGVFSLAMGLSYLKFKDNPAELLTWAVIAGSLVHFTSSYLVGRFHPAYRFYIHDPTASKEARFWRHFLIISFPAALLSKLSIFGPGYFSPVEIAGWGALLSVTINALSSNLIRPFLYAPVSALNDVGIIKGKLPVKNWPLVRNLPYSDKIPWEVKKQSLIFESTYLFLFSIKMLQLLDYSIGKELWISTATMALIGLIPGSFAYAYLYFWAQETNPNLTPAVRERMRRERLKAWRELTVEIPTGPFFRGLYITWLAKNSFNNRLLNPVWKHLWSTIVNTPGAKPLGRLAYRLHESEKARAVVRETVATTRDLTFGTIRVALHTAGDLAMAPVAPQRIVNRLGYGFDRTKQLLGISSERSKPLLARKFDPNNPRVQERLNQSPVSEAALKTCTTVLASLGSLKSPMSDPLMWK